MEPTTGPIDPIAAWYVTWGFRIWIACMLLLLFYAVFKRTKTKDQLEKEFTGDEQEED